jgi:hypothetical protein
MRSLVQVFGFFRAVPPVPPMMIATFGVLTMVSGVAVCVEPSRAAGALTPVLALQLLAASSGFSSPARRGHYDLLLTGQDRKLVALAHWLMSILPGVVSWLVLACVEIAASGGSKRLLFASGTMAALGMASTLPWALCVGLPRYAAGIGWLLVLASASATFSTPLFDEWTDATRLGDVAWSAWLFLLNPLRAVGQSLTGHVLEVAPAALIAIIAMIGAVQWIAAADVPLEVTQ